jgi:hypothetical protein
MVVGLLVGILRRMQVRVSGLIAPHADHLPEVPPGLGPLELASNAAPHPYTVVS